MQQLGPMHLNAAVEFVLWPTNDEVRLTDLKILLIVLCAMCMYQCCVAERNKKILCLGAFMREAPEALQLFLALAHIQTTEKL